MPSTILPVKCCLLSIFLYPLIQLATDRRRNPITVQVRQLVLTLCSTFCLQRIPHYSLWGWSICRVSSSLWHHLLVDVDHTDKEQDDHHQVIQDPQQSTEGGVCLRRICWWWGDGERRGGDGHHSPHTAQDHPEDKQPYKSSHGAQATSQKLQEQGGVTQVVCYLEHQRAGQRKRRKGQRGMQNCFCVFIHVMLEQHYYVNSSGMTK